MLKRYNIWDKKSPIITPIGEIFTAQQWIERYPVAALDNIVVVCGAGEINGSFFGTLGNMVQIYENKGADFSNAITNTDKLEVIEAFENEQNTSKDNGESTAEERIAAALELSNMMNMQTVNTDDPDFD